MEVLVGYKTPSVAARDATCFSSSSPPDAFERFWSLSIFGSLWKQNPISVTVWSIGWKRYGSATVPI
jgi:hypothetical protein